MRALPTLFLCFLLFGPSAAPAQTGLVMRCTGTHFKPAPAPYVAPVPVSTYPQLQCAPWNVRVVLERPLFRNGFENPKKLGQ